MGRYVLWVVNDAHLADAAQDTDAIPIRCLMNLPHRRSRGNLGCFATLLKAINFQVVKIPDIVQVMGPHTQSPGPSRLAQVAMSRVLDDQPDICVPCKVDG